VGRKRLLNELEIYYYPHPLYPSKKGLSPSPSRERGKYFIKRGVAPLKYP